MIEQLATVLNGFRFRFITERDLQDGIEAAFIEHQIAYRRELELSAADRPDFMVGRVAIEIKIKGSLPELLRQANRYAGHPDVDEILVVGTPHWLARVPSELSGKPVRTVRLIGSLL